MHSFYGPRWHHPSAGSRGRRVTAVLKTEAAASLGGCNFQRGDEILFFVRVAASAERGRGSEAIPMSSHCVSGRAGGRAGILRAPGRRRARKRGLGASGKKKKLSWVFGISAGSPGGDLCFSGCPRHGAGCPEGFLVSGRRCRVLLPWGCRRWRNAPSPGAAWLSYLPSLGSHSRRPRRLRRTTRGRWQWRDDPAESDISWEAEEEKSVGSSRVRRAPPIPSALPIPVRGLRGRNRSTPEPPCGSWENQKAPGHGVKIWGETPLFCASLPQSRMVLERVVRSTTNPRWGSGC